MLLLVRELDVGARPRRQSAARLELPATIPRAAVQHLQTPRMMNSPGPFAMSLITYHINFRARYSLNQDTI